MTKGDSFASGKGGGKHSNFFVSGRIIYTVCFFGGKFKKWFALLFSMHYMREF